MLEIHPLHQTNQIITSKALNSEHQDWLVVGNDTTAMKEMKFLFDSPCESTMLYFSHGIWSWRHTNTIDIQWPRGRLIKNTPNAVFCRNYPLIKGNKPNKAQDTRSKIIDVYELFHVLIVSNNGLDNQKMVADVK